MATDDDGHGDRTDDGPGDRDPQLAYPRGNRLGLRHPRPTVVIVAFVVVAVGAAFMWRAVARPEAMYCNLAGYGGAPTAASPEAAVQAWIHHTRQAGSVPMARLGDLPAPTSVDQFTRDGDSWIYRVDDQGLKVDVGPGYRVVAANWCGWERRP